MVLGGDIERCLGHKGGTLKNGINALIKETQKDPYPLQSCEDAARS